MLSKHVSVCLSLVTCLQSVPKARVKRHQLSSCSSSVLGTVLGTLRVMSDCLPQHMLQQGHEMWLLRSL